MEQEIIVYGTKWCGDTIRSLKILNDRTINFTWVDINKSASGARIVKEINHGFLSVPTILFADGTILVEPSNQELTDKLDSINL